MNDNDNDNVIQLFPLPHLNRFEGKITYNPHRLLIRDEEDNKMQRIRQSLEKINELMMELRHGDD